MIVWLLLLLLPARALAHGAPPAATEVLASDERGVSLVRVSRGLAYRAPDGFRFLCPESWDGNLLASVASIRRGPSLIASNTLFVVEGGRVAPHPVQAGQGFALAAHDDAVFGVFRLEGQWQLRRITGTTNELVRALAQPVDALVVHRDALRTLRFEARTIVVVSYSLAGEQGASVTWQAPSFVADAQLRVAGDELYAVVFGHSAPWVTVGRVGASYEPLREASVDIEGPITLPSGVVLGLDGTLQTLQSAAFGERVTCLGAIDGQSYACARGGDVFALDASGLQAQLFTLDGLREPDFAAVAEDVRPDCMIRWNDLSIDLAAARGGHDAGVVDAGPAGTVDAGMRAEASEGCSTTPRPNSSAWLVTLALSLRRLHRRRSSPPAKTA